MMRVNRVLFVTGLWLSVATAQASNDPLIGLGFDGGDPPSGIQAFSSDLLPFLISVRSDWTPPDPTADATVFGQSGAPSITMTGVGPGNAAGYVGWGFGVLPGSMTTIQSLSFEVGYGGAGVPTDGSAPDGNLLIAIDRDPSPSFSFLPVWVSVPVPALAAPGSGSALTKVTVDLTDPTLQVDFDGDGLSGEDVVDGIDNDSDGLVDEDSPAIWATIISGDSDDDGDGLIGEDPINGIDDDGDGAVDEDPLTPGIPGLRIPGFDFDGDGLVGEDPINGIDDDLDAQLDEDPGHGFFDIRIFPQLPDGVGTSGLGADLTFYIDDVQFNGDVVPEPGSLALIALLGAAAGSRRLRRR